MRTPSKIKSLLALLFFLFCCSPSIDAQFNPSLIGDAVAQGNDCFQITPNLNGQSGAIWSPDRINMLGNFIIEFRIFLGTNDANGADGLTFVMKNSPVPIIGGLGGGMGYQGISNSFAVEFDTWQNGSDPSFDHIAMVSGGENNHALAQNLAGPVVASAASINVEDGQEHDVRIEWNCAAQTMKVYFDCDERLIYTGDLINQVFAGSVFSYFGFTGSTGGFANLQRVCFDYISFANDVGSLDDVAICTGDTITNVDATINGAVAYLWTPATGVSNPSIADPIFTPTVNTTYTVDIINSCGDIIQEDFTATVNSLTNSGTITALETTLCEGTTTTVSSDGDTGGSWSSSDLAMAAVDATGQVTAVGPGTAVIRYTIIGTPPCLSDVSEIDITINASSDAGTITSLETTLCEGTTTTVSSDGDTGGSWSSSDLAMATVDATGTVTAVGLGTVAIRYTVAGTAPCLSDVSEIDITINASSDAGTITSLETTLCEGTTTTVSSDGDTGGSWSSSDLAMATVDATGQVTAVGLGTAVIRYTVAGTPPCLSDVSALDITVNASPNAGTITALETTLCEGTTTTVSSDGDTGGSWSSSDPALATVDSMGQVTSLVPGTVVLRYTIAGTAPCLSVVSEIDITINASSDAGTITALETSLCEGTTTTVSSDGDTGGSWSSSDLAMATVDATGQVTAVGLGTVAIRYTVAGTPPCLSDVSALDITVNASPNAGTITALETTLCEGTTTTVSSDGDTGGSWSSSDPALATVDSMGQVTSLVPGTVAIRYTIAGTAPCLSVVSEIIIRVNVLPTVIATSTDTMICLGESIILSGVGANSYIWDNGVIDNVPFIPLLGTTLYTVIGTDSDGCANSDQISITTNPFTSVTLPNSLRICAGVAEIIDAGIGFSNYLWSTGETTQRIAVSSGGDYTVSVTNSDGCDTAATVNVVASDLAVILRIDVGQFEVQTNTLTAVVTGTGDYEFSLDDFVYQNSERFSDLYPGSYTVYVRDKNGCGTVSMDVVIIGGPAFFTPNQDGYNDTWQVIAVDTIPDARIYIFDRYGKLMKQISATGLGWDGTYNGSPMPSSDYWYVVELSDGRSFNGNFALKR